RSIFILRFHLALLLAAALFALPLFHPKNSSAHTTGSQSLFRGIASVTALYQFEGALRSRSATAEEATLVNERDLAGDMTLLSTVEPSAQTGLKILLRSTAQLDASPQAKQAFVKAARTWESVVSTQMTVIIDIDYGPNCFGTPAPSDLAGATNTQLLYGEGHYLELLEHLLNGASTPEELELYYRMPQPTVPTDQGDTFNTLAPSPVYRAVGLIDRHATDDYNPPLYGPRPSIWINSSLPYDFDFTNGIDDDKYDFDAVVSREMGRVLGYYSAVGLLEANPDDPLAISAWDLFRVPPSTTLDSFSTVERILTSGGNHFFFMGGTEELPLSTGPSDLGGDGNEPSHWKDDLLLGQRIGIMDPTIPVGKRQTVTRHDVRGLDLFGYSIFPTGNNKPVISSLVADLNGDVLTLSGSLTDSDGDVLEARMQLLDKKNNILGQTAPFPVDVGILPTQNFQFDFPNMRNFPEVTQVSLTLIDSRGNLSNAVKADFTAGDAGGPRIKSAAYKSDNENLIIRGKKLKPGVQIEVNGVIINPPSGIKASKSGKDVEIEGTIEELNLRAGANRLRAIRNGLRSNVWVETF
ncbi:MAG: NF038122 family metalloprotease, partial [Acidobacteriota bacterium]